MFYVTLRLVSQLFSFALNSIDVVRLRGGSVFSGVIVCLLVSIFFMWYRYSDDTMLLRRRGGRGRDVGGGSGGL